MTENERIKNKVRRSKKWKEFRNNLKKSQKYDPITGSKLSKRAICHHLDLNIENYDILSDDRQIMLNPETHSVTHYFFGTEKKKYNWRKRVLNLINILKKMEKLNGKWDE